MNKKALYAVMLAALLPLVCYFIVKKYSDKAAHMPPRYYADTVIETTRHGKKVSDTVWHKIPELPLVNQLGDSVDWNKLQGKIIIADFFFTRCPTICPLMTRNMKRLQESIHNGQRVGDRTNQDIFFLSFSIDPERDSVERLKYWADRFQVDPEQWWLLTGEKKAIYDFAINDLRMGTVDGHGVDTSFFHSDRFVLIDSNRHVRGFYRGLDTVAIKQMASDIILLTMEKDPSKKGFLAGKLQMIAVVVLLAIIGVGLFLFIFQKNKRNAAPGLEKER